MWSWKPKRAMMSQMPEPTIVWMVHLARGEPTDGIRGRLILEDEAVVFTPAQQGNPVRFDLGSVKRAKRLKGTPVLRLDWDDQGKQRRTAFYFIQPPPLAPIEHPEGETPDLYARPLGPFSRRKNSKRANMRTNINYLQTSGVGTKYLIKEWADEIGQKVAKG
jgi:hypothetical protein